MIKIFITNTLFNYISKNQPKKINFSTWKCALLCLRGFCVKGVTCVWGYKMRTDKMGLEHSLFSKIRFLKACCFYCAALKVAAGLLPRSARVPVANKHYLIKLNNHKNIRKIDSLRREYLSVLQRVLSQPQSRRYILCGQYICRLWAPTASGNLV